MSIEKIDTLIVGGGQAGLAMSEHLSNHAIPHVILERNRIAESWHSRRWDSLVANGPAWHDRFPTMTFADTPPDGFPTKYSVAKYMEDFAKQIKAPVRTGVEVFRVHKNEGAVGFRIETSQGDMEAMNVVAATGPFQTPVCPPIVPEQAGLQQLHSNDYRNPDQLAQGAVLVVGSGSSGSQIAQEILAAGRRVYLSVGPHGRPPRSYRGRDFCWWLGVLGKWDLATVDPATAHITIAVSGANGGQTVDFRNLANDGMTLVGMTQSYRDGVLYFAQDLAANIALGDAQYLALLEEADAYVARNGLDLPPEQQAHVIGSLPECVTNPLKELDLAEAGVRSIIWATGYKLDFSWLDVGAFLEDGRPAHQRGVSSEPGVYFLGLPWLSRRGSSFIWGVWHDAKYIADQIAIKRSYFEYHELANQA